MDANRMQAQGAAQQVRGFLTETQGRVDRTLGGLRSSLGGTLGRFQGMPNGGLLGGLLAFTTVALGAMMILMPSMRESMLDGLNSRLPWGRRVSLLDRLVNRFNGLLP
ncbi:MAG: hypothetical protein ACYC3S_17310 [Chloroflexota bacterium]